MRKWLVVVAGFLLMAALSACGAKSQEDVVSALDEKVTSMKGYKANAKMTLQMGEDPQVYNVEVWHKNPDFYRVNLKNPKKDQSQMILRNKEGVFVLTPALNKSFKFQSEWPKNSSQAYLFESLVKDVMEDKDAVFKKTKKHYVFETKTRYQNNKMLPFQVITFSQKDLSPVSVKVQDPDKNTLVSVEFTKVKFNSSFDKGSFDMKRNMTSAQLAPVMGEPKDTAFTVKRPTAKIDGVELIDEEELTAANGKRFVLTYGGEQSYTLIQEKAEPAKTTLASTKMNGEPVDLGFAIGAISGHTLSWTYDGVDYMLASKDLSKDEMLMVARSVEAAPVK
ncbi:LolA family protein [Peribacillus sp. SCS-26]|uniref:LolA family protein n=1 Tax=Paraperibacillus marinus TaxID=3115295 RepID=UPI003905C7D1